MNENRKTTPESSQFRNFIGSGWAPREEILPAARDGATSAAKRRDRLSTLFPDERLVVPAGSLVVRSNDTDFPFRAHSDFAYLTGWGSDSEPDSILVFEPTAAGHDVCLYFRAPADRDSDEFYANPQIGEFWIGRRPSLAAVSAALAVPTRDLAEFAGDMMPDTLAERVARELAEMRLIKDEWEISQVRLAVESTHRGFSDIARVIKVIAGNERGERLVEGAFASRARLEGNGVGYDTIAASGAHACILHWTRNDGTVRNGDLILIDAGVELDSYYTADITRTLPVSGTFSPIQRKVYEGVRAAADAAFAIVKPGITFRDVHAEAMRVIAELTAEWGLLPVSARESLEVANQHHRRYMVHGTSHHLGLDVHDCAEARKSMYMDGIVAPGMVFTIEPGLYFQPDDLTVPAEYRGIGVRIEDNILVTESGAENLSRDIPRTADDIESWLA